MWDVVALIIGIVIVGAMWYYARVYRQAFKASFLHFNMEDYTEIELTDYIIEVDENEHITPGSPEWAKIKSGSKVIVKFVYYRDLKGKPIIHLKLDFRSRIFSLEEKLSDVEYGKLIGIQMTVKDVEERAFSAYFDNSVELKSIVNENIQRFLEKKASK